jgi:hypothetical protein
MKNKKPVDANIHCCRATSRLDRLFLQQDFKISKFKALLLHF